MRRGVRVLIVVSIVSAVLLGIANAGALYEMVAYGDRVEILEFDQPLTTYRQCFKKRFEWLPGPEYVLEDPVCGSCLLRHDRCRGTIHLQTVGKLPCECRQLARHPIQPWRPYRPKER